MLPNATLCVNATLHIRDSSGMHQGVDWVLAVYTPALMSGGIPGDMDDGGNAVASGLYLYRLKANDFMGLRNLLLK